ncbi:MAG: hypothetical protein N2484_14740 [Clostridia bacterium]|nr:hypothetical protein [Clostridia bacterium]
MTELNKQVVSILIKDQIRMITACFDEYYFIISEGVIKPIPENAREYRIGDELPVKGKTYEFPEDFDIVDLHFKLAARIRAARLYDIVPVGEYTFDNMPVVNMMGFGIRVSSREDFVEFQEDFKKFTLKEREKLAAFANKWFEIARFRAFGYQ